jgi:alpha-L-rhamnosidase
MAEQTPLNPNPMWLAGPPPQPDVCAGYRGTFTLDQDAALDLLVWGESWFVLEVDGQFAAEGPTRSEAGEHEAVAASLKLKAGKHLISATVTFIGVPTRMYPAELPFLAVDARIADKPIEIGWLVAPLPQFRQQVRRINPQLGWIEWNDTRQFPDEKSADAWKPPATVLLGTPRWNKPTIGPVQRIVHAPAAFSEDKLIERFGYESDDPPARFLLRDLHPAEGKLPPQGVWRRYDLDRVRLGRLAVTLDVPPGTVVDIAYAEHLTDGRVAPFINLSSGASCNLDHFVARGGVQEFAALMPKGGRFAEIHVRAEPEKVKFLAVKYLERTYHDKPTGSFECDDDLLNRIWLAGVETYRACSEDAIIDNPTRERGQWTGDAVVGMETASVAFDDLRLARRALVSAAKGARSDGLISGLTPGTTPMSTYACQWVGACVRYHQLTGDRSLLDDLFDAAGANFSALASFTKPQGLIDDIGWGFVDWGYVRPPGAVDPAVNLHYLNALRAMIRWCELIKRPSAKYVEAEKHIADVLKRSPADEYHVNALSLAAGLVEAGREAAVIVSMKKHVLSCFPNDPQAPRLSDPGVTSARLITPYFAHFAFPPLIARGHDAFVLDQYRKCWGWMLEDGRTTFTEVFDPRWSHCHQWSACPVWQLSRYALGLHPRFDLAPDTFDLNLRPGNLQRAKGRVPMAAGYVDVGWSRRGDEITLSLASSRKIQLRRGSDVIDIADKKSLTLPHPPAAK